MRPEASLQKSIVEALKRLGFWVLVNTTGHRAKGHVRAALGAGAPDLMVAIGDGRIVWLETKRPKGGRLSGDQLEWHTNAARNGMTVVVVDSVQAAVKVAVGFRQPKPRGMIGRIAPRTTVDVETDRRSVEVANMLAGRGYA